jgi:mannose-6-phosphate isomerase-like protein (cupin superfamily)
MFFTQRNQSPMLRKTVLFFLFFFFYFSSQVMFPSVTAQSPPKYEKGEEPNIDLFTVNWKDAAPKILYGSLEVRDLLTGLQGNPLNPKKKGAVLTSLNSVSYAILKPGAKTSPSKMYREQGLFYISSGEGVIRSGKSEAGLREGIGVLLPPGIDFTLSNTGREPLVLYIIKDPVPEGFKTGAKIIVRDDNDFPPSTNLRRAGSNQWLFGLRDGLSTFLGVDPIRYEPDSMVPPHVHFPGEEEVWIAIDSIDIQVGNEHRTLPPGTAYKVPANGKTAHSNINRDRKPKRLLWIMKSQLRQRNIPNQNKPNAPTDGLI